MKSSISYLLLALALPLQAQVHQAWIARHTLSPIGTNQAVAMSLDNDGNILIGGHGTSTNGDFDYVALKYAPSGSLLWNARYAGAGDDQVRSMKVDGEGNTVLTGTSVTVKYGTNGAEKWTAPYGGRGVAVDPSGDVYVTGFDETNYATVKLHRDAGTNLWLRTDKVLPGQRGGDVSHVIAVNSESNVFVSGKAVCYSDPRFIYLNRRTLSYNTDGGLRWEAGPDVFDGCALFSVNMRALAVTSSGEAIEAGELSEAIFIRKLSTGGQVLWNVSLYSQPIRLGILKSASTDKNGFIYLAGEAVARIGIPRPVYFAIAKLHPSGTNMWLGSYRNGPGPGIQIAHAVVVDDAGNVYGTGQSPGTNTAGDYTTIKYSPAGQELWVQRYDGPAHGEDVATAIAVAPDGSVYVTGWSTTSSNLIEITTIKYVQYQSIAVETNRTVSLQFPGTPGASNRVQATVDFLDWLDLGFSIADPNGLLHFQDTNATNFPFRFYRTVSP